MLQISNLEGKSDWINETQLIIPMIDNEELSVKDEDGMSKHTITLNSLEGGDQTLLTNGSSQTFVIGLDQSLFENYNSKSDLLLMSNSDLKLLPAVSDSKLTYNPNDHTKSEIAWENNTFEKPLAKDILNVIQDTSKSWQDMGKSGDICLEDIHPVDNKLNADFLMDPNMVQSKKLRTDGNEQYIVSYYPVVEACDTVLVPASLMMLQQKTVSNQKSIGKSDSNQLFENIENNETSKWVKSEIDNKGRIPTLKMSNTQENSLILAEENLTETVMPLINSQKSDFVDAKSNDVGINTPKCATKDKRFDVKHYENENSALLEHSLPLKKKAKMKKSPVSGSFSFLPASPSCKEPNTEVLQDEERNTEKKSKLEDMKRKRKSELSGHCLNKEKEVVSCQRNESRQGGTHYSDITQLLEQLKSEKYINDELFRILCTGLQEMGVNVLDEMHRKRGDKCPDYSNHLKAFALMIHFKQPTAFNRLGELFQSGWPPLSVIKEWKRRLNSHRKPKVT